MTYARIRYTPGSLVTRQDYENDRECLAIGGDFWTNERRLMDRAFANITVTSIRRPFLMTGLWADVTTIHADGRVTENRVYE